MGFTAEEKAAMKERAAELKAEARRGVRVGRDDGERTCWRRSQRCRRRIAPCPPALEARMEALVKKAAG